MKMKVTSYDLATNFTIKVAIDSLDWLSVLSIADRYFKASSLSSFDHKQLYMIHYRLNSL